MSSLSMILHAFRMVFFNLSASLRIGLPVLILMIAQPFVLSQVLGLSLSEAIFFDPAAEIDPVTGLPDMRGMGWFFGWSLLVGLGAVWTVVGWHRYVLLEEMPGAFGPSAPFGRVLAYIGGFILIVLIIAIPMIGVGVIGRMLAEGAMAGGDIDAMIPILLLVGLPLLLVLYVVVFRMTLTLPAAAIGKWIGPFKAYGYTKGHLGVFIGLILWAVVLALLVFGIVFAVTYVALTSGMLAGAIDSPVLAMAGVVLYALLQVFSTLIGASVLTTLYGMMVEGREIQE